MVQSRYLAIAAILGAIASLGIGMVATGQVKAYGVTIHGVSNGYCGQRGFSWEWCGFHQPQQSQLQAISWGSADGNLNNPSCIHHCSSGGGGGNGDGGGSGDDSGFIQQQPHTQQIAYTTNCFWSYPVQCN
ncbi:MAG: hypothetical protein WBE68_05485 [Candidatus Nitrosopolaris sp.]|jgi:hypothetical protein